MNKIEEYIRLIKEKDIDKLSSLLNVDVARQIIKGSTDQINEAINNILNNEYIKSLDINDPIDNSILSESTSIINNNVNILTSYVHDTNISDEERSIINSLIADIMELEDPPEARNNIITKAYLKKITIIIDNLYDFLLPRQFILTKKTRQLINKNIASIELGEHPQEGSNNILTKNTIKLINSYLDIIMELEEPTAGSDNILQISKDLINKNVNTILELQEPDAGSDNILPSSLALINANIQNLLRLVEPSAGSDNILPASKKLIDANIEIISRHQEPATGSDNIRPQSDELSNKNVNEVMKLQEPNAGSDNIRTKSDELSNRSVNEVMKLQEPNAGSDNIRTKSDELSNKNVNELLKMQEPKEGSNNVLDVSMDIINKNVNELIEMQEPNEGSNNIRPESDALSNKNANEVMKMQEPEEGSNNIRPKSDALSNANVNELLQMQHPIEGENNVLDISMGIINKNVDELMEIQEPEEGSNNIRPKSDDISNKNVDILIEMEEPEEGSNNIRPKSDEISNKNVDELKKLEEPKAGSDNIRTKSDEISNKNVDLLIKMQEPSEGSNNIRPKSDEISNKIVDEKMKMQHPIEGENNILPGSLELIDKNVGEIMEGEEPSSASDNILPLSQQIIDDNVSTLMSMIHPVEGENNIRTKSDEISNKNVDELMRMEHPIEGENNILDVSMDIINDNSKSIMSMIHPVEGENNIRPLSDDLSNKNVDELMKMQHPVEGQNNIMPEASEIINQNETRKRYNTEKSYTEKTGSQINVSSNKITIDNNIVKKLVDFTTFIGDYNNGELTYSDTDSTRYLPGSPASRSENILSEYYTASDVGKIRLQRPLNYKQTSIREAELIRYFESRGYTFEPAQTTERVNNPEMYYDIELVPTRAENIFRNYYGRSTLSENVYAKEIDVVTIINRFENIDSRQGGQPALNTLSILYPFRDSSGKFYLPSKFDGALGKATAESIIYADTPPSSINLTNYYAIDPLQKGVAQKIQSFLQIKQNYAAQLEKYNKFGENQHDFWEYTYNFIDVPGMTWLSKDSNVEDFRYYQVDKFVGELNPAGFDFGSTNKWDVSTGMRRQIDIYRNNPDISFALETFRLQYLGNPRNAQIFDPTTLFWHIEAGRNAAIDTRIDLRFFGGAPTDYLGYFIPSGAIGGLLQTAGVKGTLAEGFAKFAEAGFDILTMSPTDYGQRVSDPRPYQWYALQNNKQMSLDPINLTNRALDVAAQFINPATFSLFNDIKRYASGLGMEEDYLDQFTNDVYIAAKMGLTLGQLSGREFRKMKGRDSLTPLEDLFSTGKISFNSSLDILTSVAGSAMEDLDVFQGYVTFHGHVNDPKVWSIDERLMFNNFGGDYIYRSERKAKSGDSVVSTFTDSVKGVVDNALKYVGINNDDVFNSLGLEGQSLQIYEQWKVAGTLESNYDMSTTVDLIDAKLNLVNNSDASDFEGGIPGVEDDVWGLYNQAGRKQNWFREKNLGGTELNVYKQKLNTLAEFAHETNFDFNKIRQNDSLLDFNDGRIIYTYEDRGDIPEDNENTNKKLLYDTYKYIGTVKEIVPDIEKIYEEDRNRTLKQREEEKEREENKTVKEFTLSLKSGTKIKQRLNSFSVYKSTTDLNTLPDTLTGDVTIVYKATDGIGISEKGVESLMVTNNVDFDPKGTIINKQYHYQPTATNAEASASGESTSRVKNAKQAFSDINYLVNEIDPQIVRFWIRTISRYDYEVTPKLYYLDNNNSVQLAKPRYTGNSLIFFDSIIENLQKNTSPNWSSTNFFGRTEDVYTWQSTTQTLDFTTSIIATTPSEMPQIRATIQELERMCYPQIQSIKAVGVLALRAGPVIEFAIGDIIRAFGYITSLNISFGNGGFQNWETVKGGQFIKGAEISIGIQIFNRELPHAGTEFYAESFDPNVFYLDEKHTTQHYSRIDMIEPKVRSIPKSGSLLQRDKNQKTMADLNKQIAAGNFDLFNLFGA